MYADPRYDYNQMYAFRLGIEYNLSKEQIQLNETQEIEHNDYEDGYDFDPADED